MRSIAVLAVLALTTVVNGTLAEDTRDLTRLVVPEGKEPGLKTLKEWLGARGFEVKPHKDVLLLRKGSVLMNLAPIAYKGELSRIRVLAKFFPKDEYRGSKAFEQLVAKLNRSQNFLQVYVDTDGDLAAASNLTFYDELTARLFDAFVDTFAQIVRAHILTEEALKMLK